jgi:hypothetical protein
MGFEGMPVGDLGEHQVGDRRAETPEGEGAYSKEKYDELCKKFSADKNTVLFNAIYYMTEGDKERFEAAFNIASLDLSLLGKLGNKKALAACAAIAEWEKASSMPAADSAATYNINRQLTDTLEALYDSD